MDCSGVMEFFSTMRVHEEVGGHFSFFLLTHYSLIPPHTLGILHHHITTIIVIGTDIFVRLNCTRYSSVVRELSSVEFVQHVHVTDHYKWILISLIFRVTERDTSTSVVRIQTDAQGRCTCSVFFYYFSKCSHRHMSQKAIYTNKRDILSVHLSTWGPWPHLLYTDRLYIFWSRDDPMSDMSDRAFLNVTILEFNFWTKGLISTLKEV